MLVQNLMPGAMARAGFDLEELRRHHPRLVICSISGYGESGPYRDMKSYDMLIQAETGLASLTGPAQAPGRVGASVTDIAAGLNAYAAILEALIARQRTGDGALIRVSLFDATAEWMAVPLIHFDYGGRAPERMGLAHPSVAPYGLFATGDGKEILIAIQNEREWRRFCAEILGDAALAEDPRFSDNNRRVAHRAEVDARVAAEFARHSRSALAERLKSAEIAFGNFNTVEDFSQSSASPADRGRDPARPGSAAPGPGDIRGRAAPRPGAGSRRAHGGGARRICAMSSVYLAAAIVLEICGTTSLKLSDGFTRIGPSGAVVLCYVVSFALLALALRGIELSIAYAVWSGVGTAVVAAIGIVWFGESAGGWKLLCLGLIVLGVAGLHLAERAS